MFGRELVIFMPYMTLQSIPPIKSNGTSHQMVHVAPLWNHIQTTFQVILSCLKNESAASLAWKSKIICLNWKRNAAPNKRNSNCVAPDKKGLGKVRFRIVCLGFLIKMMGWKDLINKCEGIIIHMVWWHTIVFLYTVRTWTFLLYCFLVPTSSRSP